MKFKYLGHSSFLVDTGKAQLLFDPFITPNELAKNIDISTLNPDYILISHGHEDHLADAEAIAKQSGAVIISNFEIVSWYGAKGIEKGHPMNHGGQWNFDFGTVKYVQAAHSSTLPDGQSGGNPGGFIITADNGFTFYFAGDTALMHDMKIWGEQYKFDVVLLPVGDNFTMGIDDAYLASEFLQCNQVIAMHFDTFPYIKINHEKAKQKFSNKKFFLPEIGEEIT
ncbi:MAG: metal-dependent hydrolase, partial [Bacteroidetes bacterium]